MADEANAFAIPFDIEIHHSEPFNWRILVEVADAIEESVEQVAIAQIQALAPALREFGFTDAHIARALLRVRYERENLFWLESVESGSSKFKGRALAIAAFILGNIAWDVLGETPAYKDFIKWLYEKTAQTTTLVVEDLHIRYHRMREERGIDVKVDLKTDRVIVIVHPKTGFAELIHRVPPPPR